MQVAKHASICLICESHRLYLVRTIYDDRYGYPGAFDLLRCPDCKHTHLDIQFTPESLLDLYSNYYPRSTFHVKDHSPHKEVSGFMAWLNGARSSAFRWVPKNVSVLDIGCGFGESLGYHLARGCDVYGIEADENIQRVANQFGYNVHIGIFDSNLYEENYFDYVTLDQVIEHVSDPVKIMQGVLRVLKPGGMMILSTPNAQGWGAKLFGSRWIHWHAPYHQQFFSKESMNMATKKTGFEITDIRTITNSAWLHYQWLHLLTYPAPDEPSEFWSPHAHPGKAHKITIKGINVVNDIKINHLITRTLDIVGMGDNRIYFLRKPCAA